MNKRQRKKLMRHACPKCRSEDIIRDLYKLPTGRYTGVFVACLNENCAYGWTNPPPKESEEV